MSSSQPVSRISRRLLKLASLGLAGLIAGLLSGCTSADDNSIRARTYAQEINASDLPASLEARQAPPVHHTLISRRFE
jgi:hypothetical protein